MLYNTTQHGSYLHNTTQYVWQNGKNGRITKKNRSPQSMIKNHGQLPHLQPIQNACGVQRWQLTGGKKLGHIGDIDNDDVGAGANKGVLEVVD